MFFFCPWRKVLGCGIAYQNDMYVVFVHSLREGGKGRISSLIQMDDSFSSPSET